MNVGVNMNVNKLDQIIKNTWLKDIKDDYDHNLILNEDTMKNAIYFHLRKYFESTPEFNDLCIFTECTCYGFSSLSYRPDMIIVDTKSDEIVAVFEMKYKSKYCYKVEDLVYRDFKKLKSYMNTLDTVHQKCQYYVVAITLGDFDRANWLDERSKWAKGKVAELIAYEPNGVLEFQVIPHN